MKDNNVPVVIKNSLKNIEYYPAILDNNIQLAEYKKISLTDIVNLGGVSTNVSEAINKVFTNGGGSGFYYVNVSDGGHLAQSGAHYIGSTLNDSTNQLMSQARLSPLGINPMQLYMTLALASINAKIDECTQISQSILSYLELKDEAKIIGNINFLTDTLNSLKHNWDNPRYIESNLGVIQNIRRESEQNIAFYNNHIEVTLQNSKKLHRDKNVISQFNSLIKDGRRYQLALYTYSFSAFLGMMLEESFKSENIRSLLEKINNYTVDYRKIYTNCFDYIDMYAKTAIENYAVKGISAATKAAANLTARVPFLSKTKTDKILLTAGNRLDGANSAKNDDLLNRFTQLSETHTKQFTDSIQIVDKLFNSETKVLFDKENLYLKTS